MNLNVQSSGHLQPRTPHVPHSPTSRRCVTSFSYIDAANPFSRDAGREPGERQQHLSLLHSDGTKKKARAHKCPAERPADRREVLQNENDQLSEQNELKFTYNTNGTIKTSTDADGHTTTYEYDEKGNLKKITPPAALASPRRRSQSTRTAAPTSSPTARDTSRRSPTTATTGSPKIAYTGTGTAKTVKYEYDADGNLIKREDPTGTTKYTVDALNRVTKEELPGS